MIYEIMFDYGYDNGEDSHDDKVFEREFNVNVLEVSPVFLSESEIDVINNFKSIYINNNEYNVLQIKLCILANTEKKYLFNVVNQDHLPF